MSDKSDAPADQAATSRRPRIRFGRVQKATAIVPLALLSAAWTASVTGVDLTQTAASTITFPGPLPDGSSVPTQAIEAPASVAAPVEGSPGLAGKDAQQIVATSSTNEIPSAALTAYQRAESIINTADPSCHVTWQLIAAIGRVESDHGRTNGSSLDSNGVARPSIYGIRLNIADTDGGLLDGSSTFDRAIGPMQFIPSTWQAVAVDADNDGKRNPQDVDDAALGAAVYLCSGDGDLATTAGQRDAVFRYNHSTSYVNLVLAIADSYLNGDFMATPDGTAAGGYLTPLPPTVTKQTKTKPVRKHQGGDTKVEGGQSTTPTPATPTEPPADTGGGNGSGNGGGGGNGSGGNGGGNPGPSLPGVPGLPTPHPTLPPLPETGVEPVDKLLTKVQAVAQCTLDGYLDNILKSNDPFDQCVVAYTTTGKPPTTTP